MATDMEDVYCTLMMSDSYLPGAAVLAHSLKDAGTTKKLACLVTLDTLSADTIAELQELYDYLLPVERLANPHPANLYAMQRPDLLFAFTKIALWRQTRFRKIVYIDADIVALRAPDELFDITAPFAAAPDIGWPDAFNSGVMVISPNMGDYWALQTLSTSGDSFDGADQGLLNQYYEHRGWHRISFTYNCTPNAEYQWEPAYKYYKSRIAMVHFIGAEKPWTKGRQVGRPGVYNDLVSRWWAVHDRHLKPVFTPEQPLPSPSAAAKHVKGEAHPDSIAASTPQDLDTPSFESAEQPLTDPTERAEDLEQGKEAPVPTSEQRRFSAPQAEWDATRFAPPPKAKPEAENFPTDTYPFSQSRELFHAPSSYPAPPKDMWYEVPKSRVTPSPPKAIFPWERERPPQKPTRIFAEDIPPPPEPEQPSTPTLVLTPTRDEEDSRSNTPTPQEIVQEDPVRQEPFAPTQNAWDNVAGIERYVRAVLGAQHKTHSTKAPALPPGIVSGMGVTSTGSGEKSEHGKRRESLILTDFPSAFERPSLPVTPAPIKRPSFWGVEEKTAEEEEDDDGDAVDKTNLPAAEGVPDQSEWDPARQLESLRRASLDEFAQLSLQSGGGQMDFMNHVPLPSRDMVARSVRTPPPTRASATTATTTGGAPQDTATIHAPRPTKPAVAGKTVQVPDVPPALPEGVLSRDFAAVGGIGRGLPEGAVKEDAVSAAAAAAAASNGSAAVASGIAFRDPVYADVEGGKPAVEGEHT